MTDMTPKPIAWFPTSAKVPSQVRRALRENGYVVIQSDVAPKALAILPVTDAPSAAKLALECLCGLKDDASYYGHALKVHVFNGLMQASDQRGASR
jgi:hypothetical protein